MTINTQPPRALAVLKLPRKIADLINIAQVIVQGGRGDVEPTDLDPGDLSGRALLRTTLWPRGHDGRTAESEHRNENAGLPRRHM